jgi:hypothetical protein
MSKYRKVMPLAAGLFALVVVGSAIAVGSNTPSSSEPTAYVTTTSAAESPEAPAVALKAALTTSGATDIESAAIGSPPPGPPASERAGLPWLYATVQIPALRDGLDIQPLWEADLIQGATAEASGTSTDLYDSFGGSTFDGRLPNGTVIPDISGGQGDVAKGQVFADASASDSAIITGIDSVLQQYGLSPIAVNVLRPLGAAPSIVASTSDPSTTVAHFGQLVNSLIGRTPRFEGYYVELRDASGNALVRASAAFRTGAGRFWVAQAFRSSLVGETSGAHGSTSGT